MSSFGRFTQALGGVVETLSYASPTLTLTQSVGTSPLTTTISGGGISGSGTTGTLPKWTGSTSLGNSALVESASYIQSSKRIEADDAGYGLVAFSSAGNRQVNIGINTGEPAIQATLLNGTARQISINPNGGNTFIGSQSVIGNQLFLNALYANGITFLNTNIGVDNRNFRIISDQSVYGDFQIQKSTTQGGSTYTNLLSFAQNGDALFYKLVNINTNNGNILNFGLNGQPTITLYQNSTLFGLYNNTTGLTDFSINNTSGSAIFRSSVTALQATIKANNVFNQDGDGQITIRGASAIEKALLIGFDTTSNYGYLQSIWQGNSARPLILQPFAGSVGIGIASPDTSAKFQVDSTTQGLLVPRMNEDDINNIASPADGLLVYNLDQQVHCFWDSTGWHKYTHTNM